MAQAFVSIARALPILLLVATFTGCGETPSGPSSFAPFSREDLRLGTGATAANGQSVSVNYTLWLYDPSAADRKGPQLESTVGGSPFAFTIGSGQTIAGWNQGVVGMQEGGLRRLIIPPSLAYGADRNGMVPPNATLVFEIELLDVAEQ